MIQRAYAKVGERLVHYRYAGKGAPILLIHQSPKSSAEFEPLIEKWAQTNLVIAPDTPGYGQSDPLQNRQADVTDFASALLDFLATIKLARCAVYGFHSGAVFAVAAAKRAPEKFSAVVCNGYAVWTPQEIAAFGEKYLPPFVPQSYGEHLTWLWARMREQRFFFPWYAVDDAHRLKFPEADAAHLHANAMDMLYAGDNYRIGYGAVVRADRALPANDRAVPTLILSFDGDPLQAHLARLGTLPDVWHVQSAPTQADTERLAKAFLDAHAAPACPIDGAQTGSRRMVNGVHICLKGQPQTVLLHGPGSSGAVMLARTGIDNSCAMDLPGHGLTCQPYASVAQTLALVHETMQQLPVQPKTIIAEALSQPLALAFAHNIGLKNTDVQIIGAPLSHAATLKALRENYLTDITPDKNGFYLLAAWRRVRDSCFFDPWFDNSPAAAVPVHASLFDLDQLARAHLAALQATGGQPFLNDMIASLEKETDDGNSRRHAFAGAS